MKKNIGFGFVTFIYLVFLFISLGFIIYGIASADVKNKFLSAGVPTIIALVFGASSKSLYQFLVQAPFNFDLEKFEENKERKVISRFILFFIDLISGLAVLIYLLKISPLPTTEMAIGMIVIFIVMAILITASLIWDSKENKK